MPVGLITWEQFIATNTDSRGIRYKFEDLCRQLFANEYISHNKKIKFLHCNPNNAGLETDPIFDETNQRWIGFQAKFFDNRPGYDQILHSAEKIVENYKGKVDHVILYCNKPLSIEAENYKRSQKLLEDNNISVELVTDDTILDQVRKYPYLANYYFGSHSITYEWVVSHNRHMFATLGERFNTDFNVDTEFSLQLSLFVHDENAIKYINSKKEHLKGKINSLKWKYSQYYDYLQKIRNIVDGFEDIEYDNIMDSFGWEHIIKKTVELELEKFQVMKAQLEEEQTKLHSIAFEKNDISKEEREHAKNKYFDIGREIKSLHTLLDLPNVLAISDVERRMITGKILAITGEAGIGKSQLFANETAILLDKRRYALLLLAGSYFTDEPICEQIIRNCELDCSFNDFIDIFEAIGEKQGTIIPVFIDALNETWNNALWKNSLPQMIDKIESCKYVKLAFSFRTEYRSQLMNQSLIDKICNGDISHIAHMGFERNSIEATKKFFDFYGIPFTPSEYFAYEMTNPLFLTLYCRTYRGDEIDLPTLYDRLISDANDKIQTAMAKSLRVKGYSGTEDLLTPFVNELAEWFAQKGVRFISKEELISLNYWRQYGIVAPPFVQQVVREHILHSYIYKGKEELYFAYDQMNDYFCAKAIVNGSESKDEIRKKVINDVLQIRNGKITNLGNSDVFINICALFATKYEEECIDLIDEVRNVDEKARLISRYIQSFRWRSMKSIAKQSFLNCIIKYSPEPKDVWEVLIGNSVKTEHPLNANFLHDFLSRYELNKRDYIWTTYINMLFSDESNRVTQLIQMYDKGDSIAIKDKKQTELLLTLFGWLLTSSDRSLRDYTSKAMIELLKENFDLCEVLLKKFEHVNDPYVFQRLYGVVFGACCKRRYAQMKVFCSLSEYVYLTIFDQKNVYPDILLRDYARLIIERFLWEKSDYSGIIDRAMIAPPYKSDPIPVVDQDYTKMNFKGGLFAISMSMRFENMGMYGDFGRYVFQSALRYFMVDHRQIFNYAMSFIINDLGYKEEWFGDFDQYRKRYNYSRHDTIKVERIGKKYQWIAMYNILARVADHYKMKEPFSRGTDKELVFTGAWDPYVRDFDPTLNPNFMCCEAAPIFKQINKFIATARNENKRIALQSMNNQRKWLEDKGAFISNLKDTLILTDDRGVQWVSLTKNLTTGRENIRDEKLLVWSWLFAYFVTPEQEMEFLHGVDKRVDLLNTELTFINQITSLYNREYPWAPSCESIKKDSWINATIKTGEIITETVQVPDLSSLDVILRVLDSSEYVENEDKGDVFDNCTGEKALDVNDEVQIHEIKYKNKIIEKEDEKEIGRILYAVANLLWEEEFDASKSDSLSWSVPCAEIIETFHLRQLEYDGFYYDEDGELAAFDTTLTQLQGGVVIRKDLLDKFQEKKGMKLIWLLNGNKEIHNSDLSISKWSEWTGLLSYDKDNVKENIYMIKMKA